VNGDVRAYAMHIGLCEESSAMHGYIGLESCESHVACFMMTTNSLLRRKQKSEREVT